MQIKLIKYRSRVNVMCKLHYYTAAASHLIKRQREFLAMPPTCLPNYFTVTCQPRRYTYVKEIAPAA